MTRLERHTPRRTLPVAAVLALLPAAAQTPPAQTPCSSAEHRQFDFWIGRWAVFAPDGKKAGENSIEAIDGGCVLLERWRGSGGYTGTSLNSWDGHARLWRQHWVDNQGGLLRLAGGRDGASMVLASAEAHPRKPGVTVRQRITWSALADGVVRQHWQTSEDNGVSWSTAFDGRYQRLPR